MISILKERDRLNNYFNFLSPSDKKQVLQLSSLIEQLDIAEKQIQLLRKQVVTIKKEVSLLTKKDQEIYKPIFINLNNDIGIFKKEVEPIVNAISTVVNKAISNLKTTGTLALHRISEVTNIKQRLSQLMQKIDTSIIFVNNKIKRVENLSSDFRNTTVQIKNFTRSLVGKAPLAEVKQQGIATKSILLGLKKITMMQDRLQYIVVRAFCKIDDLQQEIKGVHMNKPKKESVSNKLKKYKQDKKSKEKSLELNECVVNKIER